MKEPGYSRQKLGAPPGTLIHVGDVKSDKAKVSLMHYAAGFCDEHVLTDLSEIEGIRKKEGVKWINVDGLHDTELIKNIGDQFDIHMLLLEDILNTNHRPKVEFLPEQIFVTLKMIGVHQDGESLVSEQVSLILGEGYLLSFQEQEGDLFDGLRDRIREQLGNVRQFGADYLMYRLMDVIVDNYFLVGEHLSNLNIELEKNVLLNSEEQHLMDIQLAKRSLLGFRKSVAPLREVISGLQKEPVDLIDEGVNRYLRDLYDHIIQLRESIETQREIISGIMDLHLSNMANRTNKVMQVLTIIATIFIPLTFLAGIYGMNFKYLPEYKWRYGYLFFWILSIVVTLCMVIYFRRKKWM